MDEFQLYSARVQVTGKYIPIDNVYAIEHGDDGTLTIASVAPGGQERAVTFAAGKWDYYEWVNLIPNSVLKMGLLRMGKFDPKFRV